MASFTDIIPQFNPYVQQLPVEAMVSVGMEKQRRYDEGLQKIQSQFEQVAGLDVVRDADKKYLQSKLNELGSNLKGFAASDFSNFQLVNSVGGMVKQVSNDKNVQNAVSSTAWYRKQLTEMEKQIAEGKSSIENIHDFEMQAQGWLGSEAPGEAFRGRYTPYIDVKKKILTEVIGKINPNLTEKDIPWEMNADGTPNVGKIAAVMSRVSGESVTSEQLQNAINASLTPAELNQLAISGRYQFKNVTSEQLVDIAKSKYDASIKDIDNVISKLEAYATGSKSDAAEYNKTQDAIAALNKRKETLSGQLEKQIKFVSQNPNEAKAEIYKDGFVNSFAEAFSWEKKKMNIIDNPYQNYAFKVADQKLAQQRLALQGAEFSWKKSMDMKNYALEMDKHNLNLKKFYGDLSGIEAYLGESTLVKDPVIAVTQDRDNAVASYNDFVKAYSKETGVTLAEAQNKLRDYQNGKKNAINVEWREEAEQAVQNSLQATRLDELLKRTKAEIETSPEIAGKREAFDKAISTLPSITYTAPSGKVVKLSNREITEFVKKYEKIMTPSKGGRGFASVGGGSTLNRDFNNFTEKEKEIYEALTSPKSQSQASRMINAVVQRYKPYVAQYEKDMEAYDDVYRAKLLEKTGKYIPKVEAIVVTDKDGAQSRDRIESLANMALNTYTGIGGSQPGGAKELSSDQAKAAKEWLASKDKGNIQYSKLTQGDKTFLVMQKGSEEYVIPLPPTMVGALPKSANEMSPLEENVREVQQHFGGNTNPTNDPTKSYFQPSAFSNVSKLAVTADLQKNRSNALNYLNLNLKLPSGWKNLQLSDIPLDVKNAQAQISTFTDSDILKIFLKDPNVSQNIKDEIIKTYQ
jgi:hypothetical protein